MLLVLGMCGEDVLTVGIGGEELLVVWTGGRLFDGRDWWGDAMVVSVVILPSRAPKGHLNKKREAHMAKLFQKHWEWGWQSAFRS